MMNVSRIFKQIENAKTIDELQRIIDSPGLKKYKLSDEKYPSLEYKITREEIDELRKMKVISEDNKVGAIGEKDILSKLLYSLIWKNGDTQKLTHIIDGIEGKERPKGSKSVVFYQFGKFISNPAKEPIIDQHVIRAFGYYNSKNRNDRKGMYYFLNLKQVTTNDMEMVKNYKEWLNKETTSELRRNKSYKKWIDKVLYALGKAIKEEAKN